MAEDVKTPEPTSTPAPAPAEASDWNEAPAPGLEETSQHDDDEGESAPTDEASPSADIPDTAAASLDDTSAGSEGTSGPTPPADAPAAEPEADKAPVDSTDKPAGLDAVVATEAEGLPESEVAPAAPTPTEGEASPEADAAKATPGEASTGSDTAAEAAPSSPTLGDVREEVSDLNDLPASALDTLRDGGCALFMFLADMADVDSAGLSQEAKARLSNVRDCTVRLLSAIEGVFIRHN